MVINYEVYWNELKEWLDKGTDNLNKLITEEDYEEHKVRLSVKRNALVMVIGKIEEIERSI